MPMPKVLFFCFKRCKPLRVATRLLSCFNGGKLTNKVHGERKKEDDGVSPPPPPPVGPELSPREICGLESRFNVGIGCCLLRLIAESKNELQNITELKIQMESVLQTVKQGLLDKDFMLSKNLESNEVLLFDQKCDDVPRQEDCLQGMDRLEAELEVEFERLLSDLDKFPTVPPEKIIEESKSCSLRHGEEGCPKLQSGVPPHELERKLHELLETRQELQIKELQAALESAKKELRKKEREISWWKDIAHLTLERVKKNPVRSTTCRCNFWHSKMR